MTYEVVVPIPVHNANEKIEEPIQVAQEEEMVAEEPVQLNNTPDIQGVHIEPMQVETRRSTRAKKHAISDDFLVYLQKAEFNSQEEDPLNFKTAIESPNNTHWQEAIQSKLDSKNKNKVWELAELPQ